MIYLTYNDQPTGVYFSQVTDVCNYVNLKFNCRIRLVALISIRGFSENKKEIKRNFADSIVLPMFPKQKNWRKNKFILELLFLFIGKQNCWSRGVFATNLAIGLKKNGRVNKVVFDGRGAYEAEYNEYLNKITGTKENIRELEKNAIHFSDYRIAVSEKLVDYWKINYNYLQNQHVIIPCTLNGDEEPTFPSENVIEKIREELGYTKQDLVFIYSGSSADWQSLKIVDDFMSLQMKQNSAIQFILLSNSKLEDLKVYKDFPQRVIRKWVSPDKVVDYLSASDYGVLLREDSVTNQVASPTKFAEYLNAGLNVLITENIGDFTKFTQDNNCGMVIKDFSVGYNFSKLDYFEKLNNFKLAQKYFIKDIYKESYKTIVELLKEK